LHFNKSVLLRDARCGELEDQVERLEFEQKRLEQGCDSLKSELKITKESLTKAHLCIQGFVTENQRLADQLEKAIAASAATVHNAVSTAEERRVSVGMNTETDNVTTSQTEAVLLRQGIELARAKFQPVLATYRGRYERTYGSLAQCRSTCELLRQRMEELADFLQQLLDSWDANETLNQSTLRHGDNANFKKRGPVCFYLLPYRYNIPVPGTYVPVLRYNTAIDYRYRYPVLRIRIWDPVHFYPKEPGSESRIRDDIFSGSRIPDPYHVPNSIYVQDFTFKNGEKQEKFNFV
jgi:hypothetical protein